MPIVFTRKDDIVPKTVSLYLLSMVSDFLIVFQVKITLYTDKLNKILYLLEINTIHKNRFHMV